MFVAVPNEVAVSVNRHNSHRATVNDRLDNSERNVQPRNDWRWVIATDPMYLLAHISECEVADNVCHQEAYEDNPRPPAGITFVAHPRIVTGGRSAVANFRANRTEPAHVNLRFTHLPPLAITIAEDFAYELRESTRIKSSGFV